MEYCVLAYYCYVEIPDPELEVRKHYLFLKDRDVRCRVYIADNGVNAQMSLLREDCEAYIDWLKSDARFSDVLFKVDPHPEHVFPRLTIKSRKQLVALDRRPNLRNRGEHLHPEKWKEMLEQRDPTTLLIDVRNRYESEVGHFEGAECPQLDSFRAFPRYADELTRRCDPKETQLMLYCTGGIRCETYSALLREKGFDRVYQLEGGVIHYGHTVGSDHWRGRLFVFDDRLTTPLGDGEHELISLCHFCDAKTDAYYNCANMDCNALFLACLACAARQQGCCCKMCERHPRRRPFVKRDRPKPFRKWYHYSATKGSREEDDEPCSCFS